jgi:hypothetical protein
MDLAPRCLLVLEQGRERPGGSGRHGC